MSVLTCLMHGEPWHHLDPARYEDTKQSIAEKVVSMVEETVCPSIRDVTDAIAFHMESEPSWVLDEFNLNDLAVPAQAEEPD